RDRPRSGAASRWPRSADRVLVPKGGLNRLPAAWICLAVILGAACGLAAGFGAAHAAPRASAWAAGINAGLLAATLVGIVWYSMETHAMWQLAVRPFLITMIDDPNGASRLIVRNVGNGPALYVRLRDLTFNWGLTVKFEAVEIVESHENVPVQARPEFG